MNGKINKREMETLRKAWNILSNWTEWAENEGMDDVKVSEWQFDMAVNAVAALCEFINGYEE